MFHQHIVKQGETLMSISEDYRIPIQSIISENQISNPKFDFRRSKNYDPWGTRS